MTDHAHTGVGAVHAGHWEVSWAPIAIAFGALFLVPLTFTSLLVYHLPLLAILFAGVGVVLTMAGIGRWIYEGATQQGVISNVSPVGIGVFIIGEALIFIGLFASYWVLRLGTGVNWPPAGTPEFNKVLPLAMTVLLVASSFTYHMAETRLHKGDRGGFFSALGITLLLGAAFLSCTIYEYVHLYSEGFTPGTNQYSAAFFSLTGFHASHVFVGLATFLGVAWGVASNKINPLFVMVAGIYWHFVDVVWFFVASQVYFW